MGDVFLQQSEQRTLGGDGIPVSVEVHIDSQNLFEYMGLAPAGARAIR